MKNINFLFLLFTFHITAASAQVFWQPVTSGTLPANAFTSDKTSDNKAMYIARAIIDGGLHIGKYVQGWQKASIPYNGEERWVDNFEVFTGSGYWQSSAKGAFHPDAVQAGYEANHSVPLYIAKAKINGEMAIGKAKRDIGAMLPWGGKENTVTDNFEVFVPYEYFRVKHKKTGRYLAFGSCDNLFGAQAQTVSTKDLPTTLWKTTESINSLENYCNWQYLGVKTTTDPKAILMGYDDGAFSGTDERSVRWKIIREAGAIRFYNEYSKLYLANGSDNNVIQAGITTVMKTNPLTGKVTVTEVNPDQYNWIIETVNIIQTSFMTIVPKLEVGSLCPTNKTNGDAEFNGGPYMSWTVELRPNDIGTRLDAYISFKAREIQGNQSTLDHTFVSSINDKRFVKTVWNAPAGKKFYKMRGTNISWKSEFKGPDAGSEFNAINCLATSYSVPEGGPVKLFTCVGDTTGDDISSDNDCNCDAQIKSISFYRDIMIYLLPR